MTRSSINKFTSRIRQHEIDTEVTDALNAWRALHMQPGLTCFATLDNIIHAIAPEAVCVFRLKRLDSIIKKVQRPNCDFKPGTLDDIAGCRIITNSVDEVQRIAERIHQTCDVKDTDDRNNYILHPQASGYRSHHIIVKVPSETSNATYRVEVQLRTHLQHLWSTSLEVEAS